MTGSQSPEQIANGIAPTTSEPHVPSEYTFLRRRFGDAVPRHMVLRGDTSVFVDAQVLRDALKALRDEHSPGYNYLSYVTAEHWIEPSTPKPLNPPIFQVIYGLQAIPSPGTRLRLIVNLPDTPDASVPSVADIHPGAEWHEREVFDLFGIRFAGHPNLTRILTPETYPEHPLRRDFPHGGPGLLEFHDRLIAEWNVAEERDYSGKFGDPWLVKILEQQTGHISIRKVFDKAGEGREVESPGDAAQREQGVPDQIAQPRPKKEVDRPC